MQPASREENETSGCATEKEDTNNDCHNADKSSSFDEKSDDLLKSVKEMLHGNKMDISDILNVTAHKTGPGYVTILVDLAK